MKPRAFARHSPGTLLLLAGVLLGGCGESPHSHAVSPVSSAPAAHSHHHAPQQGGVLAELGEEEFHIEFTHGEGPGVLRAFIMDGEVEKFVRIDLPSFAATVGSGGKDVPVVFHAVANSATGEKAGDTALFEAATGIPGNPAVTILVPAIMVKGRSYRDITATLPAN